MTKQTAPKRNPSWSRDELILALDLYMRHRDKLPGKDSQEVAELSKILNILGETLGHRHYEKYRNINGTYMKLMNFRSLDPDYTSDGKIGLAQTSFGDRSVWKDFVGRPEHLSVTAEAIRLNLTNQAGSDEIAEPDETAATEAEEGKLVTRIHRQRERSRQLVKHKKRDFLRRHGQLFCEACGITPSDVYDDRGANVIECHHTKPVHTLRAGEKTRLNELILLCANCHRAIHASRRWLTVDELRQLIAASSHDS